MLSVNIIIQHVISQHNYIVKQHTTLSIKVFMTFFQKHFSFQTFLVSGFPNHKLSFKQKRIHNIFIL